MSDDTTTTTTITVAVAYDDRVYVRQVSGTHWARDDTGRLYVYDDDQTVLEVGPSTTVLEVMREPAVDTVAITDRHTTADAETEPDADPDTTAEAGDGLDEETLDEETLVDTLDEETTTTATTTTE